MFGLNWAYNSPPVQGMDVGFGQTTWTYHLELYYAPWNRFQPYLVKDFFQAEDIKLYYQVGVFLGYVLHHTRGMPVNVNQVVNLVLWQVGGDSDVC